MNTDVITRLPIRKSVYVLSPHHGLSNTSNTSAATTRIRATVEPAARNLAHPTHMAITTISPSERSLTLWSRRSHAGSSLSATTTRPATSYGAGEHSIQVSERARLIPLSRGGSGLSSQPAPRTHGGAQVSTASAQTVRTRRVRTSSTSQTPRTASCH